MNKLNFKTDLSKTQYDLYKYKIGEVVSYGKRKVYRYPVNGVIYNLKTEHTFKYLYEVGVDQKDWDSFKESEWENYLFELNMYEDIIDHLKGLVGFNNFGTIILPEGLDLPNESYVKSDLELIVDWFRDPSFRPKSHQVYFVIFHR